MGSIPSSTSSAYIENVRPKRGREWLKIKKRTVKTGKWGHSKDDLTRHTVRSQVHTLRFTSDPPHGVERLPHVQRHLLHLGRVQQG